MTATQLKFGIAALVVAGVVTVLIHQHQTQEELRAGNDALTRQVEELKTANALLSKQAVSVKLLALQPALPLQVQTQTNAGPVDDPPFTNLLSRITNSPPQLTDAQIAAYLKANRTNAASLLAVGGREGLKEAMKKYPDDPQVTFMAVFGFGLDLPPAAKRECLNAFKKSAPDNALANYLSAQDYFNSGQIEQGMQELIEGSSKGFNDYTVERSQSLEEAYLSAGYSAAESAAFANNFVTLPALGSSKALSMNLIELANTYRQAGDQASAQAMYQTAMNLGQQIENAPSSRYAVDQLVALAIQKNALSAMDPNSPVGNDGRTVQDQLNQINQRRADIKALRSQVDALLPLLSDQDMLNYFNRLRSFGDTAAMKWVVSKFGPQGNR